LELSFDAGLHPISNADDDLCSLTQIIFLIDRDAMQNIVI